MAAVAPALPPPMVHVSGPPAVQGDLAMVGGGSGGNEMVEWPLPAPPLSCLKVFERPFGFASAVGAGGRLGVQRPRSLNPAGRRPDVPCGRLAGPVPNKASVGLPSLRPRVAPD